MARDVRSSVDDGSADFALLSAKIGERGEAARKYHDAAQDHLNLESSELLAKAELLRKSGLLDFVAARCREGGLNPAHCAFIINNGGTLQHSTGFWILPEECGTKRQYRDIKGKDDPEMNTVIKLLQEMGIPGEKIVKFPFFNKGSDDRSTQGRPAENIYVTVDGDVLDALVRTETEKRLAKVKAQYNNAVGSLRKTAQVLQEQTGHEVIDEAPEESFGFGKRFLERARKDIEKQVADELANGPGKVASREK